MITDQSSGFAENDITIVYLAAFGHAFFSHCQLLDQCAVANTTAVIRPSHVALEDSDPFCALSLSRQTCETLFRFS